MELFYFFTVFSFYSARRFGQNQPIIYTNEYTQITDSKPNTFGYPAQILIKSGLALSTIPKTDIKVIYYAYREPHQRMINPPQERVLIFETTKPEKAYIAMKFLMRGWPRYSINFLKKNIS